MAAQDGIEVFLSRGVRDPRRLEVLVRRFPRRLAAVADGCAVAT